MHQTGLQLALHRSAEAPTLLAVTWKFCSEQWHALKDKEVYTELANDAKVRYQIELVQVRRADHSVLSIVR